MSTIKFEVKNLNKSFKKQKVLVDAGITATSGDVIAFVGENGCGKSTLLNILAGTLKQDSGEVTLTLDDSAIAPSDNWKYISYVPQTNCLIESLSAYDNLLFWYQGNKEKLNEDISNGYIKELGVDKFIKKKISKMSAGMQKRVAIACALANDPKILLLDEVNASLDVVCKLQIQRIITSYAKRGNIVMLITHEEGDINVCNRIYYIHKGSVNEIAVTSLKEIFKDKL